MERSQSQRPSGLVAGSGRCGGCGGTGCAIFVGDGDGDHGDANGSTACNARSAAR